MARIDLAEWETQPDSKCYLTFLKKHGGRKVSDFFMDFLAAAEELDAKAQNCGLLQAVDDYYTEAHISITTSGKMSKSRYIATAMSNCRPAKTSR